MAVAVLLQIGSRGHEVELVQAHLLANGFDPGPVDGFFGPTTAQAVRDFQARRGLPVDGVVGPETAEALGVDLAADSDVLPSSGQSLLVELGLVAERFGLTVGECSSPEAPARWGPVHPGHAPESFHFQGRAFDASGSGQAMHAFAAFVDERVERVTELIHNPNGSIKNGARVGAAFWGDATWHAHAGHVHVAI